MSAAYDANHTVTVPGRRGRACACRAAICFGKRLKAWRMRMGLPMKRVARHLGVSASIICAWEQAVRFPNLCHLERIATYTGIPISQLLSERTEPAPEDFPEPKALIEMDEHGVVLDAGRLPFSTASGLVGSSIFLHVDGGAHARLRTALRKAKQTGRAVAGDIPFGPISRGAKWLSRVAPVAKEGATFRFLVIATDPKNTPLRAMDYGAMQETMNDRLCELSGHLKSAAVRLHDFRRSMGRTLEERRLAELQGMADDLHSCWRLLAGMGTRPPTPVEIFTAEENPPGDILA